MTEADLIRMAKGGDERAFTEIFNKYWRPVYRFIFWRVRNEADAKDLTMECFEKAFASIKQFVPFFKLNTWLHEIARNRVTDFFRVKQRTPPMSELDYMIKDINNPEREYIAKEGNKIVREGIRAFKNDTHRKVMILYCQGWKMREIASELDIPIGSVVNFIHVSKNKLKKLVA